MYISFYPHRWLNNTYFTYLLTFGCRQCESKIFIREKINFHNLYIQLADCLHPPHQQQQQGHLQHLKWDVSLEHPIVPPQQQQDFSVQQQPQRQHPVGYLVQQQLTVSCFGRNRKHLSHHQLKFTNELMKKSLTELMYPASHQALMYRFEADCFLDPPTF